MPTIKAKDYSVYIGSGALTSLSSFLAKHNYASVFILCDENTLPACLPTLIHHCPSLATAEIIEIESGELSKSLDHSALIWQTLLEQGADKQSLLVNLGGGVVSDLGGFTASVYKRGIHFVNVPTSLLAMADASVGGKTGIDFMNIKNTIGTFAQAQGVFIFPEFLETLPERHLRNGLAEIAKIALVKDAGLWKKLQQPNGRANTEALLTNSVRLKNSIVLKDPLDKGLRKILNFGHSIGHALEALYLGTEQELLHGEAVVAGMLIESHIAWQKKLLSKKDLNTLTDTLLHLFGKPLRFIAEPDALLNALRNDKKNKGNQFLFALITGIGFCEFDQRVSVLQINKALTYYNALHP